MKPFWNMLVLGAALLLSPACGAADEIGTEKQAKVMLGSAVERIRVVGVERAGREITARGAPYVDRDLYVTVYDRTGKCLAHAANPKMVGKDLIDLQDADGKFIIRERMELARKHAAFSQEIKFTDPLTKKVLPKTMYCAQTNDVIACVGIYKR